jgi:hypothetical protein
MATGNTKRNASKSSNDLYNTPFEAIDALYKKVYFDPILKYLEPCVGLGNISNYLDSRDISMFKNDLIDYGKVKLDLNQDFLAFEETVQYDYIITNPPYNLAKEFVLKGLKVAKQQWLLVRVSFLESQDRSCFFKGKYMKRVIIFTSRIGCTQGLDEKPKASCVMYCWINFDRDYIGSPILEWFEKI